MLRLFADETGDYENEKDLIFGMAALVGDVHTWHKIQSQWEDALACCGVTRFHATDLQAFAEDYKGWTSFQRERFVALLIRVIKENTLGLRLAGSATAMAHYRDLPAERQTRLGSAYGNAAMHAMGQALDFAVEEYGEQPIEFIFDNKTKHFHILKESYDAIAGIHSHGHLCAGLTMANHRLVSPVQVADLVAYESNKYANGRINGKGRDDLRWPARQLDQFFSESKMVIFDWHSLMLVSDFDGEYEKGLRQLGWR
jgi:hypothetical protein